MPMSHSIFSFSPPRAGIRERNVAGSQLYLMALSKVTSTPPGAIKAGDPLAPSLFILAEDLGLSQLFLSGATFTTSGNCPLISHLLYADDTIIFVNGTKSSLSKLMDFLSRALDPGRSQALAAMH